MGKCLKVLVVLVAGWSLAGAAEAPKLRLSEVQSVEPISYRADLHLDPAKTTFSGSIKIKLEIRKATDTIWLNQEQIQVQKAVLTAGGKANAAKILPGGDDFVGFQFNAAIPEGAAEFDIDYTGKILEKNSAAIFRQEDNGNWYLFTQFEATDARGAFPCFDEPSYKTKWQLTLHVPANQAAVGNTPIESERVEGNTKVLAFKETLPLPSYLVAFGVGPFEFVDAGKVGKKKAPVRIVVPKGHAGEAKYAAEVTATILTRLEEYFGIPFPYEKSDQVAIPSTVGFGAMENPGMVTYSQTILLADPKSDTVTRQREYATVAAHELAHQWFGDLVTTAWWDDIWLNEAFATWMEAKIIAEWKPEWDTRVGDVGSKLGAQVEDSLLSARKVRQEIKTKDDINNAFDGITYQKGAAVIGMFESWMGPEDFRKGVQNYMKHYSFRATTSGDFLDTISSASKKDVTRSFSTFLNQAGVPSVSMALDCNKPTPTLHLEQKRFLPLGSKGSTDQVWSIPVCVRYGSGESGTSQCVLLDKPQMDMPLNKAKSCPEWVQGNDGARGYYRVEYADDLAAALVKGNVGKRLSAPERVDFMGNAKALYSAGKLSGSDALKLAESFHDDPERHVLLSAIDLALEPRKDLVPETLTPNYQRYLLKNFQSRAHELGWTPKAGEPEDVNLLRPSVLLAVATWGGDEQLAKQAGELAQKWFTDRSAVDPNLVGAILKTAAFYGDKALFERFVAEYKKTKDRQEKRKLIAATAYFRDPAAIEFGMKSLVAGDVSFLDGGQVLFNGLLLPGTRKLPLQFLKANFDQVVAKMPTGGGFDFGSVLPQAGSAFCDAKSEAEVKQFFQPVVNRFVGAPRALDQVLEEIDLCTATKAAQEESVVAFLSQY